MQDNDFNDNAGQAMGSAVLPHDPMIQIRWSQWPAACQHLDDQPAWRAAGTRRDSRSLTRLVVPKRLG